MFEYPPFPLIEDQLKLLKQHQIIEPLRYFEDIQILLNPMNGSIKHSCHHLSFLPAANEFEAGDVMVEKKQNLVFKGYPYIPMILYILLKSSAF